MDNQLQVTEHAVAGSANATQADAKDWFNDFIINARSARKTAMTVVGLGEQWLAFIADTRTNPPAYYICDTDRLEDLAKNRQKAFGYIKELRRLSKGQVNESNTVYKGFPMQRYTPDAWVPLAWWMLARLKVRMQAEPMRAVKDLLSDCFKEWRDVTANSEDLQKELVRHVHTSMTAGARKEQPCT